jgi:hypothetical protein
MEEKLRKAIEILADEVKVGIKSDDALKITQAACNLANTIRCLGFLDKED